MNIENIPIGSTPQGYATPDQMTRQKKIAELLMMGSGQSQHSINPMQFNQANDLERPSGLHNAEQFAEGTQEPQQSDPVKNEASRFALLAQKYSGKPVGAAVSEWTKGHPGAEFVPNKAGLDPETPITPELLKSPQGLALVKAMADLDAGGSAPLTEQHLMQAQQMAFGGPEAAGGEGNVEEGSGQALAYGNPQGGPAGGGAMDGITAALKGGAPAGGAPPVPGGPVTRAPLEAAQPGNGIPPGVLPHRIPMSREGLINTLASSYISDPIKQMALKLYMEQSQPMQMQVPGGTMNISPSGQTWVVPQLFQGTMDAGGAKMPVGFTFPWDPKNPNTIKQEFAPSGMGGAQPTAGPLGTAPPSSTGQGVIPPQMQGLADFSNEQKRIQSFNDEDLKNTYTKVKESTDMGLNAERNLPQLRQMRHMIEDPKLQQSIGSDIVLDWNRIKALAGSKDGERAAALMQAFDKMASGQIISDLRTNFQGLGQIRVKEMELMEKASANRYNTREANRAVLDLMVRANEQIAGLGKATAEYLATHKQNASTAGLIQAKQKWLEEHPMLNEKEIANYNGKFDADPKYPTQQPSSGRGRPNPKPVAPKAPVWDGKPTPALPPGFTPE